MNKLKFLILPLLTFSLCSCDVGTELNKKSFYFDTYVNTRLFEGSEDNLKDINKIFSKIDKLTDNYKARDIANLYTVNTNEKQKIVLDSDLYELFYLAMRDSKVKTLKYYSPFFGSLSKKWKESLAKGKVLDNETITSELDKADKTVIGFYDEESAVYKVGEGEIDFGAVAKGFALDKVKSYLDSKKITKYLVDCGSSSILLGEKEGGKNFNIQISNLSNSYLSLKNCVISTSSMSRQMVVIDGKKYSHIINPKTGSAINKNDAAIVISKDGYLGDILSTDFVNEEVDDIKALEKKFSVKTIIIRNNKVIYKSKNLEILKG